MDRKTPPTGLLVAPLLDLECSEKKDTWWAGLRGRSEWIVNERMRSANSTLKPQDSTKRRELEAIADHCSSRRLLSISKFSRATTFLNLRSSFYRLQGWVILLTSSPGLSRY